MRRRGDKFKRRFVFSFSTPRDLPRDLPRDSLRELHDTIPMS